MNPGILLLPGYLYGTGNLLLRLLNRKRGAGFGESIAASLALWSITGWLTPGFYGQTVLLFSFTGTLWLLYSIMVKAEKKSHSAIPVLFFFLAMLLRYIPTIPFTYPYGRDFIMHTYSTATITVHNGFSSQYYPFGIEGFGAFNIGFHFISAGLSFLSGMTPMDSTVATVYIFWGLLFWALYRWTGNPAVSLLTILLLPYPMTYLRWGGFPTVAAISMGLLAYRKPMRESALYWTGAFSIHFIPTMIPFLVYLVQHRKEWKRPLYFTPMLLLLPQYFLILRYSLTMSPSEMKTLDSFVISTFPKSAVIVALILLLSIEGYRYRKNCSIPVWGIVLSIAAGLISYLAARFHIPINFPKSMYLSRMILLMLPPAAMGIHYLMNRFRFLIPGLVPLSLLFMVAIHSKVALNPGDMEVLKAHKGKEGWFLTLYESEGAYLPALGVPAWASHYIISQLDEFKNAAFRAGFTHVVCDSDIKTSSIDYYNEVCGAGLTHPDVESIEGKGRTITIYRLKKRVHLRN